MCAQPQIPLKLGVINISKLQDRIRQNFDIDNVNPMSWT